MSHEERKIRVGILGASGYTGAELIRLLIKHPNVEIVLLTADRHAGNPISLVFPHLFGLNLPNLIKIDEVKWANLEADFIFCALPHGTTQEVVAGVLQHRSNDVADKLVQEGREDLTASIPDGVRVIDLSADFRIQDGDTYAEWYGHSHRAPQLQSQAVYGLTELARHDIAQAQLVACPGCYPTSALLPLAPLVGAGQIDLDDIIIDSKSGVTGAGRAAKESGLYGEVSEGIHAYGLGGHRHSPEIEQELAQIAGRSIKVNFTPHLVPMNRGILSTIYVRLLGGATAADLRDTLVARYRDEPFVGVVPEGMSPATRHVRGSNHSLLGVFEGRVRGRAVVLSVLDNLVKGASGQAVQNMNVMCQLPETLSLEQRPLFP